jgi:hypothetical protein
MASRAFLGLRQRVVERSIGGRSRECDKVVNISVLHKSFDARIRTAIIPFLLRKI